MTEQEWLACTDPTPMLEFLRGKISDRKLRLFAVACCRRVWDLLEYDASRRAVEVAERYADGLSGTDELRATVELAAGPARTAAGADAWTAARDTAAAVVDAVYEHASWPPDWAQGLIASQLAKNETGAQAALLRDILGNLFGPLVALDGAVLANRGGAVWQLAAAIYEGRHFKEVSTLADLLEEAGCTGAGLLDHLRGPGPHVRGCWVLDLLLGKE
jgi:hypothetical protein